MFQEEEVKVQEAVAEEKMGLDQTLASIERQKILSALKQAQGNRTLTAKSLGITRSRLYRRLESLGINPGTSPFSR